MDLWEVGHADDDNAYWLASLPGVSAAGVSFSPPLSFRPKSRIFPLLNTNPNIWAFVQQTTKAIEDLNLKSQGHSNLSQTQKQVIKSLQINSEIIIKCADKGGNLVIMNTTQYEIMCKNILTNKKWYRPISKTVLENICIEYHTIIFKAYQQGTINKNTWSFLNILKFQSFTPYRKYNATQPPGRPIISGCASLTRAGLFLNVDHSRPGPV